MSKRFVNWFIACAALAAALFATLTNASPARACCIYNHTIHPLRAGSNIDGMHDWIVHPSNHRCTRGTGDKKVTFWLTPPSESGIPISTTRELWVAKHGWISVYRKHDGRWKAVSHNSDGSVHSTIYLEPQD